MQLAPLRRGHLAHQALHDLVPVGFSRGFVNGEGGGGGLRAASAGRVGTFWELYFCKSRKHIHIDADMLPPPSRGFSPMCVSSSVSSSPLLLSPPPPTPPRRLPPPPPPPPPPHGPCNQSGTRE
jgi:hypothetical protein